MPALQAAAPQQSEAKVQDVSPLLHPELHAVDGIWDNYSITESQSILG